MRNTTEQILAWLALIIAFGAIGISAVQNHPVLETKPKVPTTPSPPCIWYAESQIEYVAPELYVLPTTPLSM